MAALDLLSRVFDRSNIILLCLIAGLAYPVYVTLESVARALTRRIVKIVKVTTGWQAAINDVNAQDLVARAIIGQANAISTRLRAEVAEIGRLNEILRRHRFLLSHSVLTSELQEIRTMELRTQTLYYAITLFDDSAKNLATAAVNLPTYLSRIPRENVPLDREYFLRLARFGKTLNDETVRYNVRIAAIEMLEPKDLAWLKSSLSSDKNLQTGAGKFLQELLA